MTQKFTQIKFLEFDFWTGDGKLNSVSVDLGEDERGSGCQFSFYDPNLQIASYLFQLSQASGGITTPFDLLDSNNPSGGVPGSSTPTPTPTPTPGPGPTPTPGGGDPTPGQGVPGRDLSIADLHKFCDVAIVSIFGLTTENKPTGGTGFIVDASGIMITNHHVYDAAKAVDVDITFRDGSQGKVKWLHWSKELDLAIGQISKTGVAKFPVIQVSKTFNVTIGQTLYTIGMSNALDRNATPPKLVLEKGWDLLSGQVSALSVKNVIEPGNVGQGKFFETTSDNFIDKGDSGSPVFNKQGVCIGVGHAMDSAQPPAKERAYSIRVDALRQWYQSKMGRAIPDPIVGPVQGSGGSGNPGLPPTGGTTPPAEPPPTAPPPTTNPPPEPPPPTNPPGTSGKTSTGIWLSDAKDGLKNDELAKKIIQYCKVAGVTSINHQATILANIQHETLMGVYTEEIGGANARYAPWFGRGLIQITWESNYKKAGEKLGVDFISGQNRELVKLLKYAIPIAVLGMRDGWFTGKKLSDYGS